MPFQNVMKFRIYIPDNFLEKHHSDDEDQSYGWCWMRLKKLTWSGCVFKGLQMIKMGSTTSNRNVWAKANGKLLRLVSCYPADAIIAMRLYYRYPNLAALPKIF